MTLYDDSLALYAYMPYIVIIVYIHTYTLPHTFTIIIYSVYIYMYIIYNIYIYNIYNILYIIRIIYTYDYMHYYYMLDYPHACSNICNVLHEYIKYYLYGIYIFVYHCIAFLHTRLFSRFFQVSVGLSAAFGGENVHWSKSESQQALLHVRITDRFCCCRHCPN